MGALRLPARYSVRRSPLFVLIAAMLAVTLAVVVGQGVRPAEAAYIPGSLTYAIIPVNVSPFPENIGRINLATGAISGRFPAPVDGNGTAAGIAFDGERIYYSSGFNGDNTVRILSTTGVVIGSFQLQFPVSGTSVGLQFRNGSLFSGRGSSLYEFDAADGSLLNTFSVNPNSTWTMGDGNDFYTFVNSVTIGPSIREYDLSSGTGVLVDEFPTPGGQFSLALGWTDGDLVISEIHNTDPLLRRISIVDIDSPIHAILSQTVIQFGADEVLLTGLATSAPPPALDAGGPYSVNEGSSVNLTGTCTPSCTTAGGRVYGWDFDGNGTFDVSGTSATFSGVDGPAIATVRFGTCLDGSCQFVNGSVTINNVPPFITSSPPTTASTGVEYVY